MAAPARMLLAGRYELGDLLGRGGMAFVYRGTDKVLGRSVAIKVLSPALAGEPKAVERFRREAQAAAALSHPGIVTVFDTGSEGDLHYIVMELVEGRSLSAILAERGRLRPETAAAVAARVADALAYAHEAGVVHRDVKPGNIMVTEGRVKVMDFGIARVLSSHTLTDTAAILGTASYLAPEQAQGRAVDARTDVYALGVVLYQMLTGRPPFVADSAVAVAVKHVGDPPTPPSEIDPAVPADLDAEVMRALAKDPGERQASAAELASRLDAIKDRLLAGAPLDASETLNGHHLAPGDGDEEPGAEAVPKRRWARIGVLAVVLLAGLVSIAFVAPERSATRERPRDQQTERSERNDRRGTEADRGADDAAGSSTVTTASDPNRPSGQRGRRQGPRQGSRSSEPAPASDDREKEAPDPPEPQPTEGPTEEPPPEPSPSPVPSPTEAVGSGGKGSAGGL